MIYPIVEYAKSIGKNTSDFTTTDLVAFTKWWMKRPEKDKVMEKIKAQQHRAAKVGHQLQEDKKGATDMSKRTNLAAFQAAQHSRLNPEQIEEIEDVSEAEIEEVAEEMEEMIQEVDENVVATIGLTREDVAALLWSINTVLEEYEFEGNPMGEVLVALKEALDQA